jgi:hypothetical protein
VKGTAIKPPFLLFSLGSLAVAVFAFAEPVVFFSQSIFLGVGLSALWVLLVIAGVVVYRQRGLWLLLGAPFALTWPVTLGLYVAGCALGYGCP